MTVAFASNDCLADELGASEALEAFSTFPREGKHYFRSP